MAMVSVADFKEYQHIDHDHEDKLLEGLIAQAQTAAENWCRATFSEEDAPGPVILAVKMYAGYHYEHRSAPDEKSYAAMRKAFCDLLSPYCDPEKEF